MRKEKQVRIIGIIPARMKSSRFEGKVLADIHGMPLIGHVFFRSKMSRFLTDLYITSPDKEVEEYANLIGARFVLTSDKNPTAIDRVGEAIRKIDKKDNQETDVVIMIQGDEPMIRAELIDSLAKFMVADKEKKYAAINYLDKITSIKEHRDPNVLKVILDKWGDWLFYSRMPIPCFFRKEPIKELMLKQTGLVGFRKSFLFAFRKLKKPLLELSEVSDLMRALYHGFKIHGIVGGEYPLFSVDTPNDLTLVKKKMKNDLLMKKYLIK